MKSTNGTFFSRDNMASINLHIVKLGKAFLAITQNPPVTKGKINKLGLWKLKILYVKGHYKETENTTHRMAENTLKSHIW